MTGLKKEESENQQITTLFPQLTQSEFQNILKELGNINRFEFKTVIDNNLEGKIRVNLTFFNSEFDSSVIMVVCKKRANGLVINEREKIEIIESGERSEEIIEPFIKIDISGSILLANQSLKSLLNFPFLMLNCTVKTFLN